MSGRFKNLKEILRQTILVLGGGVIGLSTAVALAHEGFKVTLLEKRTVGRGCSWVAGGILSALPPWGYGDAVATLLAASQRLYPEWIAKLTKESGLDPEYLQSGMIVLPPYDRPAASRYARNSDNDVREVPAQDIEATLAPGVTGLWLPHISQVRSSRLLKALASSARALGVSIIEQTEVLALNISTESVHRAKTRDEVYSADIVIVCAGAWSQQLLGAHALALDIRPMRGEILLFKDKPCTRPIIFRNGFYLITRSDGHVLAGSTLEDVGFDAQPTPAARNLLWNQAVDLLPTLRHAPVQAHWAGLRPGSPGNLPTISAHPYIKNLYVNAGHFRYGITMAPLSAAILTALILDTPPPIDVTPYRWRIRQSPNGSLN